MKDLKYLNKYFWKYKHHLILGILFTIISNFFQIIPAPLVRYAFDLVADNIIIYKSFQFASNQPEFYEIMILTISMYAIIILLMAFIRGIFLFLIRQTIIIMSRLIEYDLKNEIFNHYQTLPLDFYRRNKTGDLMNRISEDVSKVRMYLGPCIMYGLSMLTLFAMLIPYMLSINVELTLYALLPLPLLSLSIYYINNKINKKSEEIQETQSAISTFLQEAFSGIRVLKSFNREDDSLRAFNDKNQTYKEKSLGLTKIQAFFFPLIMVLIGLSSILTVYMGGRQVILGNLTFGNIAEFLIYINLLTWPVTSLGWISSIIQRAEASQKRINEFLKEQNNILSTDNLEKKISGKIEFKNVSFAYPGAEILTLSNLSFVVNPGESVAIIGPTGSGKTTITNLISRMYDVSSGEISIDDISISTYNLNWLRNQIGYVPQDVFLFSDTIYNNITFGSNQANENEVYTAVKDADIYDNIMEFPQKFETKLGERGITLSGGQKQRVSIARAIIKNPVIFMLDDSLSAIDTKTENTILNSLKKIMKGKTTIIVSHRVSSAKLADKVIVLIDGKIVENGTHEELMKQKNYYKDLYEEQMQLESQ